jgi:transposase-like protein
MSDKPRPMPVAAPSTDRSPYHGYRFPPEIIAHAVWLYFRFHLSFRDVEDLLAERGILVSHEGIRQWCTKFGAAFARGLRRRRARPGDKWHLDEVLLKICGKRHWLWRAVDPPIRFRLSTTPHRASRRLAGCHPGRSAPMTPYPSELTHAFNCPVPLSNSPT